MKKKDLIKRNETWFIKAQELYMLQEARKQLLIREEEISVGLRKLSMGVSSTAGGYVYRRTLRKGTINYKMIEMLESIDLDPYRGQEIETWKLYANQS